MLGARCAEDRERSDGEGGGGGGVQTRLLVGVEMRNKRLIQGKIIQNWQMIITSTTREVSPATAKYRLYDETEVSTEIYITAETCV